MNLGGTKSLSFTEIISVFRCELRGLKANLRHDPFFRLLLESYWRNTLIGEIQQKLKNEQKIIWMDNLSDYKPLSCKLNENPGLHTNTYLEHITDRTTFC